MFAIDGRTRLSMVFFIALGMTTAAIAEPVAMVTDLSGAASNDGMVLEILTEFEPGNTVSLVDGTTLSMVFYGDGSEYIFTGPAKFEVGENKPSILSGAEPTVGAGSSQGSGAVSTIGLAQAAMVMRGNNSEPKLTLLFPAETTLLSAPDMFQWRALDNGVGYSFELTDFEGRSMIETTVNGTTLEVPEHLDLKSGGYYTWSLETRLPDGQKFSNWASFSVADSDLLASVAQRRPGEEENVSRLVLFRQILSQIWR